MDLQNARINAIYGQQQLRRDRYRVQQTRLRLGNQALELEIQRQTRAERAHFESTAQSPLDHLDDRRIREWQQIENNIRESVYANRHLYTNL